MEPNTEYGTWGEHGGGDFITVEETVGSAMEGTTAEEVAAAAAEYRKRINTALPPGVVLAGQDFYGPYPRDPELDIAAIIRGLDEESILWPDAARRPLPEAGRGQCGTAVTVSGRKAGLLSSSVEAERRVSHPDSAPPA